MAATRFPSLAGHIAPATYAIAAPGLILLQIGAVALVHRLSGARLVPDAIFWLLPLRRLLALPMMVPWLAALAFGLSLMVAWGLAILSFRRATTSRAGFLAAALAVVPGVQIFAVALLMLAPSRADSAAAAPPPVAGKAVAHAVQGLLAGMAILVLGVLISAVGLGSYG